MVDLNNLTEQEADDVAASTLWNALPPALRAGVADGMTREQRAEVRQALGRAKEITGR